MPTMNFRETVIRTLRGESLTEEFQSAKAETRNQNEQLDEGAINRFVHSQMAKLVPKHHYWGAHRDMARGIIDKHMGPSHPQRNKLVQKYEKLANDANYDKSDDKTARHTLAKHLDDCHNEAKAIAKKHPKSQWDKDNEND